MSDLRLDDGAVTVFLNAKGKADDVSKELKAFLDFMIGKPSDDPFIMELEAQLWEAKQDSRFRRDFMLLLSHEDEARAEGREEGIAIGEARGEARGKEETKRLFIEKMMEYGMNPNEITQILGLKA